MNSGADYKARETDIAQPVMTTPVGGNQGGDYVVQPVEPYTLAIRGREGGADLEHRQDGTSNAILTPSGGRAGIGVGAVAYGFDWQSGGDCRGLDLKPTVQLQAHQTPASLSDMRVRRLTPTECERLQGFPDGYTAVIIVKRNRHGNPTRRRVAADGPRYKALGNSMAVPVMAWIGRRIAEVSSIISLKEAA